MVCVRGCDFPDDRYYDPARNLWLKPEDSGLIVIGATSYAVAQAVEFFGFYPKPVGTVVEAERAVAMIELAKTVASVRTVLAGAIAAVNLSAQENPSYINTDPYGDGWLVKLKPANWNSAVSHLVYGVQIAAAFEAEMVRDGFDGVTR
jgi:glycine cleavage system H protein